MSTHDAKGREYAKLSDLKAGMAVEIDDGFECRPAGQVLIHEDGDDKTFFFGCYEGRHYVDGQLDEDGDHLIGIYPVEPK